MSGSYQPNGKEMERLAAFAAEVSAQYSVWDKCTRCGSTLHRGNHTGKPCPVCGKIDWLNPNEQNPGEWKT